MTTAALINVALQGWTDDAIETLRRLAADRQSASTIAANLGCSRNAVIGKARRLEISVDSRPDQATIKRVETRPVVARPWRAPSPARAETDSPQRLKAVPFFERTSDDDAALVAGGGGVTLRRLESGRCKWPIGDPREETFRFCGAVALDADNPDAPAKPYCPGHASRAFNAPATKRATRSVRYWTSLDRRS